MYMRLHTPYVETYNAYYDMHVMTCGRFPNKKLSEWKWKKMKLATNIFLNTNALLTEKILFFK